MKSIEGFIPHLLELRKRAMHCCIAFGLLLIPMFYYSAQLYTLVATPILKTLPLGSHLIATQVITPFTTPLRLALFATLMLIIPYMFYHAWSFIAPALYRHEKRTIKPIIVGSLGLFYLGVGFAHFVVLPMALSFFINITPVNVMIMTDLTHYLDFILTLYFAFGMAFQVPIITLLCIQMGLVTIQTLKKNRPYVIVGAFIVGMLLTPPDVVSQILLAIPLLALFETGLILASFLKKTQSTELQA